MSLRLSQLAYQTHGDLACHADLGMNGSTMSSNQIEVPVRVTFRQDDVRGLDLQRRGEEVPGALSAYGFGDRLVAQRRHGGHTVQRRFQLADVLGEPFRWSG